MKLKVLHVSTFDTGGGAARAAMRLHKGLLKFGVDSQFLAIKPVCRDVTTFTPLRNWQVGAALLKRHTASRLASLQKTPSNQVIHSIGLFPSGLGRWISNSQFDIVNLHWICAEALSVREIARIRKPIVWTMHDMWPIMGAEHYDDLEYPGRWRTNYQAASRPPTHCGLDIDRYVWKRKAKLWKDQSFHLVSPSRWLACCARASALMSSQPCEVIHNPLDTAHFKPVDMMQARQILGLPSSKKLILFGALGATSDHRKGYDLLVGALQHLEQNYGVASDADVVVFGGDIGGEIPGVSMKAHFLGSVQDEISLRLIYSAADVFVAPSRQDNLPNMVVEAGSCGLATAAFNVGGLPDIITNGVTGMLAEPFDANALADAIQGLLRIPIDREAVRASTQAKFSLESTVPAYLALYRDILKFA